MRSESEVQGLLDSLHDAVVEDLGLEGTDLVLNIRLVVDWIHHPDGPRLPEAPLAQAYRLVTRPYRLVFEGFQGPVPWGLKGQSLDLVEEKDGAYLLVSDALQEYVVRAKGLSLRAAPPAGKDNSQKGKETIS